MSTTMSTTGAPERLRRITSPIGRIEIAGDGTAVTAVAIERAGWLPWADEAERGDEIVDRAAAQLEEYFAGDRTAFDVPVGFAGTPFQVAVWERIAGIPFGVTVSYGELGRATGRTTAGRAVGGAVGANPVPIIVPCHRVLGSDGRVTGYSGGNGIPTKLWLLRHEGVTLAWANESAEARPAALVTSAA